MGSRRSPVLSLAALSLAVLWQMLGPHILLGQDRSGVRPEVLSLPDGPGSIEGLGESFEPSPATGTSSYSVPISLPPGVAGFVPSLSLRYSSGGGNGELGIGWTMGMPMVQRGTDEGLPEYDDAVDRFVLRGMGGRGAEDLVEMSDGSYRFRIEGAFARGRRRSDGSFEFRNRGGVAFRFGTTPESQRQNPDDPTQVFSWCLTEQEDTHGNLIRYEYSHDAGGHPYLERIIWNDFSPSSRNEVVFVREDRPDVVTTFLPGFADALGRRVVRIDVLHGGEIVRRYELSYDMMLGLSRLTSVHLLGRDLSTDLPALTLTYLPFDPDAAEVVTMVSAPSRALGDVTEISDVDGDALPDLLVADPGLDGGRWSWVPNLDGVTWGAREILASSPSVWLASTDLQLADMDGDGSADAVARLTGASDGFRYWGGGTSAGFDAAATTISPNPSFGFEDPDVRLADLDHDRLSDWMRIDPTTGDVYVAFNRGGGAFTSAVLLPRVSSSEVVSFSRGARLADMNGDGLTDLVAVRSESVRYWPGIGRGRFADQVTLVGAPTLSAPELAEIDVRDVNGDGLGDLIHVGVSRVRIWAAQATASGGSLTPLMDLTGTPERRPTTVVRVADMNGNGTADIVWVDPASTTPWRYLDLMPAGTPGLFSRIENGLGRSTSIEYAGLGEMRRWARENGVTWTRRSPIGQSVVFRITTESGLDPATVTEMRYVDGYYDGPAREFRGFARSVRIELGDPLPSAAQPTLLTDMAFDVGDADEARKGLALSTTRADETGAIFDTTRTTYEVRTLATSADGTPLRYAVRRAEEREIVERSSAPRTLRSEFDEDEYGNVIRYASLGEVRGGDASVGDDETIVESTYAIDVSRWIVDRIASSTTRDFSGARVAESRTYYDGPAFEGLPLGSVERGDVTRTESWISGDRFANDSRVERDSYGNAVVTRDARGGRHELSYDEASHTFVVAERLFPSEDPSSVLTWTAEHDEGFGRVRSVTDPNLERNEVVYDALARPIAMVMPGDSIALPTRRYTYTLDSPLSNVRTETRETSGEEGTIIEIAWTDGLGRSRGSYREAGGGTWAVTGLSAYGRRGLASLAARPSFERSADLVRDLTGRNGITTAYDAVGRAVSTRDVDGSETRVDYDPLARRAWDENDVDAGSVHANTPITYEEDGLGRLRRVVWLEGIRQVPTSYEYDALGNLTRIVDAENRVRTYAYDGRSRLTESTDPNTGTWTRDYTDGNDLARRTDATGRVVRSEFDALGRLLEEWHQFPGESERLSVVVHYDAPSADHPELGFTRAQPAYIEDDAGMLFLGYDARGRLVDRIRRLASGVEHATWTDFDAMDRPTRRGFPDATHLTFGYDERGLLNRLGDLVVDIGWTAWGAAETIEYGNGVVDVHGFDERQRMTSLRATSGTTVLRDLFHALDPASRIVAVEDRRPDGTPAMNHGARYTYDDLYRLETATDALATTTWAYDDVGNILTVASGHSDPFLNVTNRYGEEGAGPDQLTHHGDEAFVYDEAGRVIADGERTLEYDARGRLSRVVRTTATGAITEDYVYAWDDERILKRTSGGGVDDEVVYIDRDVEVRGSRVVRYAFLGDQRVVRLDAIDGEGVATSPITSTGAEGATAALLPEGSWHHRRFHAGDVFVSFQASSLALMLLLLAAAIAIPGNRRRRFTTAGAVAIGLGVGCDGAIPPNLRGVSVPVLGWPTHAVLYLADHLNSPVALADVDGLATHETPRHPYGAARGGVRNVGDPWDYVGNEADMGSGLSDFNARPYRPEIGRFYASEPLLLAAGSPPTIGQLRAYAYSHDDPVNVVDPSGLDGLVLSLSPEFAGLGVHLGATLSLELAYSDGEWDFGPTFALSGGTSVGLHGGVAAQVGYSTAPASSALLTGSLSAGATGRFAFGGGLTAGGAVEVGSVDTSGDASFSGARTWSIGAEAGAGGAVSIEGTTDVHIDVLELPSLVVDGVDAMVQGIDTMLLGNATLERAVRRSHGARVEPTGRVADQRPSHRAANFCLGPAEPEPARAGVNMSRDYSLDVSE